MDKSDDLDCLIIGGGPAGLTAALYMARFRRRMLLIDAAESRAALIPMTHNFPGFPGGISGRDLLRRLRQQAERYGAPVQEGCVDALSATRGGFIAEIGNRRIVAANVILTTGVKDNDPGIADVRTATLNGSVRWCPICDGHEVIDQHVAVLGSASHGPAHARFLRTYTRHVTLFVRPRDGEVTASEQDELARLGIRTISAPIKSIVPVSPGGTRVRTSSGTEFCFDSLYPMLGHVTRSQLAVGLGAACDETGNLIVDDHQQTTVPGLYAAGDLVKALNQMAVGTAHATIAATAVHNSLKPNYC